MIKKPTNRGAEQETLPLDTAALSSARAFCHYLQYYALSSLDVTLAARVRYASVWNIAHGIAVKSAHANQVRWGLHKLTGVPYMAPIVVTPPDTPR